MTELQRDTLAYGVVAAASAYLLIWIIPAYTDARRDNSASSGMITSTKTELQIPQ